MTDVGSDKWIPALKGLCLDFLKSLQDKPGGQYLLFRDFIGTEANPGKIINEYNKSLNAYKREIFGKDADKFPPGHHKIASLYIRSFLIYQPFCLYDHIPEGIKKPELCLATKLPNEFFAICLLEAIFKSWREELDGELRLDPSYRGTFIKLLYYYKNDIEKLDILSFADIIFFIEKNYFTKGKKGV
jgi:hypothetical protein